MADNLSETSSYWNWRFGETTNLNYTDLFNVTPVDVPYNNIGRVKSFFLETRPAYVEDRISRIYANVLDSRHEDFTLTDAKIIWDEDCYHKNGRMRLSYINVNKNRKKITYFDIENEQIVYRDPYHNRQRVKEYPVDLCCDNRIHTVDYVKNYIKTQDYFNWKETDYEAHFYQENAILDWVVEQWYLGIEEIDKDGHFDYEDSSWTLKQITNMREFMLATWIKEGNYVLIYSADHKDDSWSCWQVRQILGTDDSGTKLRLSSTWLWLKTIKENESSIKWYWVKVAFFESWWETVVFSSLKWLHLVKDNPSKDNDWDSILMCDYGISTVERVVSDMEIFNNRLCVLYSNGYIQYWGSWYNLFFFTTDNVNYVGKDKIWLISWRNVLLVLWKSKIDVWIWDTNSDSLYIYTQSKVLWVHNKYSYWEFEGSICIISSEANPRFLSCKIANTYWNQMLEFEDIGWYIQSKLDKIRDEEEVYLWTMKNELRIYINAHTSPMQSHHPDCTRIIMFSKKFQVRYEHFTYSIIRWSVENIYFGSWLIWHSKYEENWDIRTEDDYYIAVWDESTYWVREEVTDIKTIISWYINENEYNNWQVDASWWPIDLFRILKVKAINILLWYGIYSYNTKLSITNYRSWYWETMVIDNIYKNKGINVISHVAEWEEIQDECVDADISDNEVMADSCDSKITLSDVECQKLLCHGMWAFDYNYDRLRLNDTGICVNWWRYKYSNTYPLHINVNETQKPSELVKMELTSVGDSISFGWAIVELNVYPLDYTWPDNEYTVDFDEDCPKKFIRDTGGCFRNLIH